MRNYIASTLAATGLIVFIFGMDCSAQTVARITANIPFDFYVGTELLPKGRYEFETANKQVHPSSLIVRPTVKTTQRAMIVPTIAAAATRSDAGFALVFNRYGTVHYLSSIASDPNGIALKLVRTSDEKRLARTVERAVPVTISPSDTGGR